MEEKKYIAYSNTWFDFSQNEKLNKDARFNNVCRNSKFLLTWLNEHIICCEAWIREFCQSTWIGYGGGTAYPWVRTAKFFPKKKYRVRPGTSRYGSGYGSTHPSPPPHRPDHPLWTLLLPAFLIAQQPNSSSATQQQWQWPTNSSSGDPSNGRTSRVTTATLSSAAKWWSVMFELRFRSESGRK